MGLVFLFVLGFGWAVTPVNPNMLRGNPRRSYAIVAVAGPVANLIMAVLYAVPLRLGWVDLTIPTSILPTPGLVLLMGVWINLFLMVFNLMPIPLLDGFTILQGLLPPDLAYRLDGLRQYGTMILLAVLIIPQFIGSQFSVFSRVLYPIVDQLMTLLAGIGLDQYYFFLGLVFSAG
jgi:Zn-dependent protease